MLFEHWDTDGVLEAWSQKARDAARLARHSDPEYGDSFKGKLPRPNDGRALSPLMRGEAKRALLKIGPSHPRYKALKRAASGEALSDADNRAVHIHLGHLPPLASSKSSSGSPGYS